MFTEMKDKFGKEYYRRVIILKSSNLKDGNKIRAINFRAVSLVRHSSESCRQEITYNYDDE